MKAYIVQASYKVIHTNIGIAVSELILEALCGGKKPLVVVTLNGYSYRSAVGKMGNTFMISLSAQYFSNK